MSELITYLLPVAALAFGIKFGRKASIFALIVCVLATVALSLTLRAAVAKSGEYGWEYYGEGTSADVGLAFGMGFVMATLALIGPSIFSRWQYAFGCSATFVIVFQATTVPALFALCALFAACI